MHSLNLLGTDLWLLPEKAIYIPRLEILLVTDIHLGKSEAFQVRGIPIPHQVNLVTLQRLQALSHQFNPQRIIILGDLFHSRSALVDEVLKVWNELLANMPSEVHLIAGNHDRPLMSALHGKTVAHWNDILQIENLVFSHEAHPQPDCINFCGHVHPCIKLQTKLDRLRLPCFYLDQTQNVITLPSFGEFTGGYEVSVGPGKMAYVVAENRVVPFEP